MAKGKKKKGGETPDTLTEQSEEPLPPAQEKSDEEFLQKYSGENSQAMWFRNIIRAQAKHVMEEAIADEVQKATGNIKQLLPEFESQILQNVNKKFQETSKIIEELQTENKKLRRSVEKLQFHLNQKDEKMAELAIKLDSIEQREFTNDVQIVGIEESIGR